MRIAGLLRSGLPTHLEDPDTYEGVGYLDDDDVEEDYSWGAGDGSNRREEGTAPGEEPKFTNYRDIFKGTLDYIFFRQEALLQGSENQGARVLVDKCLAMISEGIMCECMCVCLSVCLYCIVVEEIKRGGGDE
jgi:hypothetical protein